MNKSLLLSILIHALLIAAAGFMVLRVPEKPAEPVKMVLRLSPPLAQPEVTPAVTEEPILRPEKTLPASKQRPKEQLPAPVAEKTLLPVKPVPAPIKTAEPPMQAMVNVSAPVKSAVAPKESAPVKVAAEPRKSDPKVKDAYLQHLRETIDARKVYPRNAKRLRQSGTVTVRFTVQSDGTLSNVSIASSSGFELLDDAASELLVSIAKVRPIPEELGEETMAISLPIEYSLR